MLQTNKQRQKSSSRCGNCSTKKYVPCYVNSTLLNIVIIAINFVKKSKKPIVDLKFPQEFPFQDLSALQENQHGRYGKNAPIFCFTISVVCVFF